MKSLAALLAVITLPLAAAPAAAQFQPGLRAPQDIRDGVSQSLLMGCVFATSGRPANGLNMPLDTNGASLTHGRHIPDTLQGLVDSLAGNVRLVVLDTPGGAVWTFFDPATYRCLVVPAPADAEGIEAELLRIMGFGHDYWREAARAGGRAFEQDFDGNALLGTRAGRMRAYYQPADGPARPQMIVVERVSR